MPSKKERGLLVLIDDGFFARLDYETSLRRSALKAKGLKAWRIPRTFVVRDLLKFALDSFARERGEVVPSAEPVSVEELRATDTTPDSPASAEDVEPRGIEGAAAFGHGARLMNFEAVEEAFGVEEAASEAVCEDSDREAEGVAAEGAEEDLALGGVKVLTAETGPPPKRVTVGRVGGDGGRRMHLMGVRSGR